MLEEAAVIAVRGLEVLLLEPGLVGRDEPVRGELEAEKGMAEDDDALLGQLRADRMDLPELRGESEEPAEVAGRARDPRIALPCRSLGRRRREAQLPVQRDAAGRILREQPVQERGPAARQTRDDERPAD